MLPFYIVIGTTQNLEEVCGPILDTIDVTASGFVSERNLNSLDFCRSRAGMREGHIFEQQDTKWS
jgi:hypothetical protein